MDYMRLGVVAWLQGGGQATCTQRKLHRQRRRIEFRDSAPRAPNTEQQESLTLAFHEESGMESLPRFCVQFVCLADGQTGANDDFTAGRGWRPAMAACDGVPVCVVWWSAGRSETGSGAVAALLRAPLRCPPLPLRGARRPPTRSGALSLSPPPPLLLCVRGAGGQV
jgi:hypothetical protein